MLGDRTPEKLRDASYQSLIANAKDILEKHFETTVNGHRIGGLSAVEIRIEDLDLPYRWQHENAPMVLRDSKQANLTFRGKNVGDITIYTARVHAFSKDDQHLLEVIASYLNIEVSNIRRRYRSDLGTNALIEIDNQIKELVETKQAYGAEPYKPIWKFIAKKAMELTYAQEASIFRVINEQERRGILRVVSQPESAETPEGKLFEFGDKTRLSARVAETGEPIIVFDRKDYPELTHTTFESMIGIPMYDASQNGKPEVIAVMNIRSHHPRAFDATDVPLLQALANQGVVALKFARLIDQTRQIVGVGDAISAEAAHVKIEDAASNILQSIVDALSREGRDIRGIIRILNPLDATLDEMSVSGFNLDEVEFSDYLAANRQFPIHENEQPRGLIGWVVENASSRRWPEQTADLSEGQPPAPHIIPIYDIHSQMSIAIRGGRALDKNKLPHDLRKKHVVRGVISILSSKENAFSWLDYELLIAFAKVIEQVWARIRMQKRIEALAKVASHSSKQSDNLIAFYGYIWETIYDIFFAEHNIFFAEQVPSKPDPEKMFVGTLYLYDGFRQLRRVMGTGQQKKYEESYQRIDVDFKGTRELGVQAWVAGRNARKDSKNKPIYLNIPDIDFKEGRTAVASDGTMVDFIKDKFPISGLQHTGTGSKLLSKSELCVPILSSDDELVGTLNIESPVPHAFDDNDAQFLIAIGRQVAYALEGKALRDAEQLNLRNQDKLNIHHDLGNFAAKISQREDLPGDIRDDAKKLLVKFQSVVEQHKSFGTELNNRETTSVEEILSAVNDSITAENAHTKRLINKSPLPDEKMLKLRVEAPLEDVNSIMLCFIRNVVKHRQHSRDQIAICIELSLEVTDTLRIAVLDDGGLSEEVESDPEKTDWKLEGFLGVNQQGTEKRTGIGLGLAMANLIARICGGRVILDYHKGNKHIELEPGFSASLVLKIAIDHSDERTE